jgi:ribosomal protein S7
MSDMRIAANHLFSSPEGQQALAVLANTITVLGPLEEVRSIRYLAELGRSIQSHKGGLS